MDEASRTARGRKGSATAVLVAVLVALVTAFAVLGTQVGHPPADPPPTRAVGAGVGVVAPGDRIAFTISWQPS
ncbi:hypothetical protein, partial [Streptomyces sp. NPDC001020]